MPKVNNDKNNNINNNNMTMTDVKGFLSLLDLFD